MHNFKMHEFNFSEVMLIQGEKKLMLFQIQISREFHYRVFPWVYREQIVI